MALGFAARFITGYLYLPDRDGPTWLGGGATHAWCQIYVPGSGWVEFDPDREDELGMKVEVNVKTASALRADLIDFGGR